MQRERATAAEMVCLRKTATESLVKVPKVVQWLALSAWQLIPMEAEEPDISLVREEEVRDMAHQGATLQIQGMAGLEPLLLGGMTLRHSSWAAAGEDPDRALSSLRVENPQVRSVRV